MAAETANERDILEELHHVPQNRWDDVLSFIRSLRSSAPPASKKRTMTAADLLCSDLIGMWDGRADIVDSHEFARRLRERAQSRRGD